MASSSEVATSSAFMWRWKNSGTFLTGKIQNSMLPQVEATTWKVRECFGGGDAKLTSHDTKTWTTKVNIVLMTRCISVKYITWLS